MKPTDTEQHLTTSTNIGRHRQTTTDIDQHQPTSTDTNRFRFRKKKIPSFYEKHGVSTWVPMGTNLF